MCKQQQTRTASALTLAIELERASVFVSTLDCNNRRYSYCISDVRDSSPSGEFAQRAEVQLAHDTLGFIVGCFANSKGPVVSFAGKPAGWRVVAWLSAWSTCLLAALPFACLLDVALCPLHPSPSRVVIWFPRGRRQAAGAPQKRGGV